MHDVLVILLQVIDVYKWILFGRIILSWLPNINWNKQPWATLEAVTEPVFAPFRRLIPPFNGIDFSPMILFLVLNIVQDALYRLVAR
jgi:YggT family protein